MYLIFATKASKNFMSNLYSELLCLVNADISHFQISHVTHLKASFQLQAFSVHVL